MRLAFRSSPPALILLGVKRLPKGSAGFTVGPIVLIKDGYEADIGLVEHELTHVRQFWWSFGLFLILYLLSKRYRFQAEVEAYRVQLYTYGLDPLGRDRLARLFANFIATRYSLDITRDEAYMALVRALDIKKSGLE